MKIVPLEVFSITTLLIAVEPVASRPSASLSTLHLGFRFHDFNARCNIIGGIPRGGSISMNDNIGTMDTSAAIDTDQSNQNKELSLDEKVHAAMKKLGLNPPSTASLPESVEEISDTNFSDATNAESSILDGNTVSSDGNFLEECPDGVCEISLGKDASDAITTDNNDGNEIQNDPNVLAENISQKMQVDLNMAWAALGATSVATESNTRFYNEKAACDMIQMELDMISQIQEDSDDVTLLVAEGYKPFFVRRALAFAERNVDDARAILLADRMDEEEDAAAEAAKVDEANKVARLEEKRQLESSFKTVNVDAGFDPTKMGQEQVEPSIPKAASRDSVIFEGTAAQIQELVLESPVPVLLDIYADWCGPCKALSPILEDMAIKSGGSLRLVKVNSDNERAISQALEVTALPTIFGVREGKILHMFQGMPKSEDMMKNFLMGLLIPGQSFNPPVSESQQQKYIELSTKLMKVAATASFTFSARERLQDRIASQIDSLVQQTGNVFDAEQSVVTIRSLLSNIIRDPYEAKFRTVNLSNNVIAMKIAQYPACLAMLKSIGFARDGSTMAIRKGKPFVNVAPLAVARDAIDKWIDRTRYEVAREARKRRDEEDRKRIQVEIMVAREIEDSTLNSADDEVDAFDPDACQLKFRFDGKKKIHQISLRADDPLSTLLERILNDTNIALHIDGDEPEILITCVAKRLVVKSTDQDAMKKSFRDYGLVPTASIVIKLPPVTRTNSDDEASASTPLKLADRAASRKKLKKGTHTMQSIGVYSTEDNAKGELIDGGGGTWYEHDVDDDEVETIVNSSDTSQIDEGDIGIESTKDHELDEVTEEI
jgi:thioredoxin 1